MGNLALCKRFHLFLCVSSKLLGTVGIRGSTDYEQFNLLLKRNRVAAAVLLSRFCMNKA